MPVSQLVTVLGNLSIDYVNDGPATPGGCPSFAGVALAGLGEQARIVMRADPDDLPLFRTVLDAMPVPWQVLPALTTSSFRLHYGGDHRVMTVASFGPVWTPRDIVAAELDSSWVHIAPLLRGDFLVETLAAAAAGGRRIGFDGQGLVRRPELGSLRLDARFDRALLNSITVLKLADDEADVIAGGSFGTNAARALGVPEILVTNGPGGCVLYADDAVAHIPAAWQVRDVQTTGAGDIFVTAYVAARAEGRRPPDAAEHASRVVAEHLHARFAEASAHEPDGPGRLDAALRAISGQLRAARRTRPRRDPRPR